MTHTNNWMKRAFTAIVLLSLLASCGSSEKAVVHQGWDARYLYDEKKRRLHPYYDNRRVGKSIGRDERGKVDYKVWWSDQIVNENLLKKNPR
jgi:hypothetical protein